MEQGYSWAFARVYNLWWTDFARDAAPRVLDYYEHTEIGTTDHTLLDLCCGTGQMSRSFLEHGYHVTGLDLSDAMLEHAAANNSEYVKTGQARFVQGDASDYQLDEQFGLVVSSFGSLNHLPSFEALRGCFACTRAMTKAGGTFIFDLNTRSGLQRWNNVTVQDSDEAMVVYRGIYDGGDKAYSRVTGFARDEDGRYSRFEQTTYNTVYDLDAVRAALLETGWRDAYFARISDLATPLDEPEREARVFVVATC
jgi:SAM-dependent methyltransferase